MKRNMLMAAAIACLTVMLFVPLAARWQAGSELPNSVAVAEGTHLGGSLSDLHSSNDSYYSIQAAMLTGGAYYARANIGFQSSALVGATSAQLKFEHHVTVTGVSVLVFAYNYQTGTYENIKAVATGLSDTVSTVTLTTAQMAKYVNASGQASFALRVINPVKLGFPPPVQFNFYIDHATLGPIPAPPTSLTATTLSSQAISLTWTDNSTQEDGFRIERKGGASGTTYVHVADVGANQVAYTNSGLTASTLYTYRVRAFNVYGNSAWSNEAAATTNATTPSVGIELTAIATSSTKITLYWLGDSAAIGYNLYRSTSAGGPYTKINGSPVNPIDPGPGLTNAFMYSDTGRTTGTEYFYVVRSVINAGGTEGVTSNESSDQPSADAIPYDTGDVVQIVSKIDTLGASTVSNWSPTGRTVAVGPNGVTYSKGGSQTVDTYGPQGSFDTSTNLLLGSDSQIYPVTMDGFANDGPGLHKPSSSPIMWAAVQVLSSLSANAAAPTMKVAVQLPGYNPTPQPSGPYRKVEALPGFHQLSSTVLLPNPLAGGRQLNGGNIAPGSATDTAYIYTGIDRDTGRQVHVDVGFQLGSQFNPGWKIYGLSKAGKQWTLAPKAFDSIYVNGSPFISFTVCSPGGLPNQHGIFLVDSAGGAGQFAFTTNITGPPEGQYRYSIVVRNLKRTELNTANLKRVNSVAQRLRFTKSNGTVVNPTAPIPNGPTGGLFESGAAILGGGWGSIFLEETKVDGALLEALVNVYRQGSYPGNPYVNWVAHNPYFWEESINVKTTAF